MKIALAFVLMSFCMSQVVDAQTLAQGVWAMRGGVTYQKKAFYELGVAKTSAGPERVGKGITYSLPTTTIHYDVALIGEIHPSVRHLVVAPKLSTGLTLVFIGLRANIAAYTDFNQTDVRFIPEAGLTWFGFINLFYGYNIPVSPSSSLEHMIGRHRVSFSMNYFFFD